MISGRLGMRIASGLKLAVLPPRSGEGMGFVGYSIIVLSYKKKMNLGNQLHL